MATTRELDERIEEYFLYCAKRAINDMPAEKVAAELGDASPELLYKRLA